MPVPGPQLHRHGACSTAHLAERCRPFADVHLLRHADKQLQEIQVVTCKAWSTLTTGTV